MTFTLLGGRLCLEGPRPSEDGLWLAAGVPPLPPGSRVLDAAAGSGVVGLALALRQPGVAVEALELQPALAQQANANAMLNGLADYACHEGDILDFTSARTFDAVVCNPPFHAAARGHRSPDAARHLARHQPPGLLGQWLEKLLPLAGEKGEVYLVLHQAGLAGLKALLPGLGASAQVAALATRAGAPPKRALARLRRDGTGGWMELGPVETHQKTRREAVLARGGALILWPRWPSGD